MSVNGYNPMAGRLSGALACSSLSGEPPAHLLSEVILMSRGKLVTKLYREIFMEQRGRCGLCYEPLVFLHHIIPKSMGGDNKNGNVVGLCASCHSRLHAYYNKLALIEARAACGDLFFENALRSFDIEGRARNAITVL